MAIITTKDATEIFYKDWGPKDAQPIGFHHGWPLSSDDRDNQMLFFLANGYRVVNYASDYRQVDGIVFPVARRVVAYEGDYRPVKEPVLVAIDMKGISVL